MSVGRQPYSNEDPDFETICLSVAIYTPHSLQYYSLDDCPNRDVQSLCSWNASHNTMPPR